MYSEYDGCEGLALFQKEPVLAQRVCCTEQSFNAFSFWARVSYCLRECVDSDTVSLCLCGCPPSPSFRCLHVIAFQQPPTSTIRISCVIKGMHRRRDDSVF